MHKVTQVYSKIKIRKNILKKSKILSLLIYSIFLVHSPIADKIKNFRISDDNLKKFFCDSFLKFEIHKSDNIKSKNISSIVFIRKYFRKKFFPNFFYLFISIFLSFFRHLTN